jgi:hypothetical protein
MRERKILYWAMIATIAIAFLPALAQQNEGPILRPKNSVPATLLVMCDLACKWKLDGEPKGSIETGGSAKAKVQFGQHMVFAVTDDGLDKAYKIVEVQENGQIAVTIELKPVRNARLIIEQALQDKAAREQQEKEKAAQEQAVREQQERNRLARERAAQEELDRLIWIDPTTGLMWTKHDNGFQLSNGKEAYTYCSTLHLAGFADWRLPTIDELASITNPWGWQEGKGAMKGDIQISGEVLIGDKLGKLRKDGSQEVDVWSFTFWNGERFESVVSSNMNRALCVRRASL